MSQLVTQITDFAVRLFQGGTLEIVLLIVLVIVALILFLVALWIAWKLLILLGKGLLWVFRAGSDTVKGQAQARREAGLAKPPLVATGWDSSPRLGLRRAIGEAHRLAGRDALHAIIVAGDGTSDLCRSLGLLPPGVGSIGIAAGTGIILVDASKADDRMLRRLANALPWRRPADAAVVLVGPDGFPGDAVDRATSFANMTSMCVALHFVFASTGQIAAWRVIDARNRDSRAICAQLAADAVRVWLSGDVPREGLKALNQAQTHELPVALERAISTAQGSSSVDIASLCFSGRGLRAAIARTADRTRPATAPSVAMWGGIAALTAGVGLVLLVVAVGVDRASALRGMVDIAVREAIVPWTAQGIDSVPSSARVRRIAGLATRLAEQSELSALMPLAVFVPNHDAPRDLGAAFLRAYVLRPMASALDRRSLELLEPGDDPARWIDQARRVGEWLVAWEALAEAPYEVDLRRLLAEAFGGDEQAWPEGTDLSLVSTSAKLPSLATGGLDTDRLIRLARSNFVVTMQRWADKVYTNGPVATAARRVSDRSAGWREQHDALTDLRVALQDPAQQWLTAAEDTPDLAFELRLLGRALGISILGQAIAIESKAAVAKIRIAARKAPDFFLLPEVGRLMVRLSTGGSGGSGPSLVMSPAAEAWLAFLDRVAGAGFADLPRAHPPPLAGRVTLDPVQVAETLRKLQVFDRFASDLPSDLPPVPARNLVRELTNELVLGVTASVEQALRPHTDSESPARRAEQLARIRPSLADLSKIEAWLRERHAYDEANRLLLIHGRIAESELSAGAEELAWEDPLGVYPDPAADGNALVRRFERGLARLYQMHEQLGAPFVEAALRIGGSAAAEWQAIARDIEAHRRGDADAALSGLAGMVYAYAEDAGAACESPRSLDAAIARTDYVAYALSRFRLEIDRTCASRKLAAARAVFRSLVRYFSRNIAWLWPYAGDPGAPEVPASAMGEFVERLVDARATLTELDEPLAFFLLKNADFWLHEDSGGAVVRFRIDWRTRRGEERLAEHVISLDLEGAEVDEDGVHVWRYGSPLSLKARLAQNSSWRFAEAGEAEQLEAVVTHAGSGAFLRIFSGLSGGAWTFEAPLVDQQGRRDELRVSARIAHPDGRPLTLPAFSEYPRKLLALSPEMGGG